MIIPNKKIYYMYHKPITPDIQQWITDDIKIAQITTNEHRINRIFKTSIEWGNKNLGIALFDQGIVFLIQPNNKDWILMEKLKGNLTKKISISYAGLFELIEEE